MIEQKQQSPQNAFQGLCMKYGIRLRDFRNCGLSYDTAYQHWVGRRLLTFPSAKKYSEKFGIPINEFFSLLERPEKEG